MIDYQLKLRNIDIKGVLLIGIFFLVALPNTHSQAEEQEVLTGCLLDLDMPLSKRTIDTTSMLPGFYYELGEMIAKQLGRKFRPYYTMAAFHKRPAREGILAKNCEIQFGMPYTEGPHYLEGEVELTKPFIQMGYALVLPRQVKINNYKDLTGMKVAVLTGSPPQMALSAMSDVTMEYCVFSKVALEKLERGEVDVAFIWGPEAGYLNKFHYMNKFVVIPTNYEWPVAIGTAYADIDLRNQINRIIGQISSQIEMLKDKYGFPSDVRLQMPGFRYDFKD